MNELDRTVTVGSVWKHFKGKHVATVITLAKHTETGEIMVIYVCYATEDMTKTGIYARPLEMFLSEVDYNKYPNARQKHRFERIA